MMLAELLDRSASALGRARTVRVRGHFASGAATARPLRKACARPLGEGGARRLDCAGWPLSGAARISSLRSTLSIRNYVLIGAALAAVIAVPAFLSQLSGAATSPGATAPAAALASALPTPVVAGLGLTDGIDLSDLAAKTLLVLGLLYLTLRVLRRMQGGGQPRGDGIAVLESRAIAPKTSLLVVSVRGRELVLGLSPAGLVTLADLDEQHSARSQASGPRDDRQPHLEPGHELTASRRGLVEGVPQWPSTRRVRGRAA